MRFTDAAKLITRLFALLQFINDDGKRMVEQIAIPRLRPSLQDDSASIATRDRSCGECCNCASRLLADPKSCTEGSGFAGEAVDCWAKDCWWEGFVLETFDDRLSVAFKGGSLRPVKDYTGGSTNLV